jgi:hypothetical protein
MAKRLTWMGLLLAGVAAAGQARAEDEDVLVVPLEPDGDVAPSAAAAEDVRGALVRRGVGVLARPETRLEQVAPVQSTAKLSVEIGTLARAAWAARSRARPAEVADLALQLRPYLPALRSAPLDGEIRGECGKSCTWVITAQDALVGVCIDGAEALQVTGRLGEGHDIIEACAELPWLHRSLSDPLKPVYGALSRSAELRVATVPAGLPVRVAGEKPAVQEVWPLRVRDGGRFPVTAECPQGPRRVHWVDVASGARELAVTIDCDLDAATHVDGHGLWLSSSGYAASAHARALGRMVAAGQVLTVERNSGRFRLQLRSVARDGSGASVALPIGYSTRQLERAVDGLFTAKAASAPVATAALSAPVVTPPSSSTPWAVWSGAALLVAGAGLDVAAWAVERHRSARADTLYGQLALIPSSQDRWISLRPAILRLGGSAAAVGAAGAALLVAGLPDEATPWWAAGTAAAVGAGLGAWGAAELSQGRLCSGEDMRQCAPHEAQRDRGAVLMATAAPFLAVPLTKLVRRAWRGPRHETVAVSVAAYGLRVSGRW